MSKQTAAFCVNGLLDVVIVAVSKTARKPVKILRVCSVKLLCWLSGSAVQLVLSPYVGNWKQHIFGMSESHKGAAKALASLLTDETKAMGRGTTALITKGYIPAPSSDGSSCTQLSPGKGIGCFLLGFQPGCGLPFWTTSSCLS